MKNPISTAVGMPALKGLPLTSGHSSSWSGEYPTFIPNYEVFDVLSQKGHRMEFLAAEVAEILVEYGVEPHEYGSVVNGLRKNPKAWLDFMMRYDGNITSAGRIAIQSFCAPQCDYYDKEWEMLSFIRSLKSMVRSSNTVAFLTFPPSLLSSSVSKRLQHLADTLLSIKAIPDEDKELATLLTGYQDMLGLLTMNKVSRFNTQVPVILDATTYSIKLQKRRSLVLECLNQAPVDGSSGSSYVTSGSCGSSSKTGGGTIDF